MVKSDAAMIATINIFEFEIYIEFSHSHIQNV